MPQSTAKIKNKFTVLFEVGTARVAASVISVPTGEDKLPPVIVWEEERHLNFPHSPDDKHLLIKTLTALKEVASAVHTKWPALTDQAHCILASPFYRARTKVSSFDEPEGFTITPDLLGTLRDKEIEEFLTLTTKPYEGIVGDKPQMLEYRVLKLTSNDYPIPVDDLPDFTVTNLELTSYLSLSSEVIVKKFKEIIRGTGHFKEVAFHSYMLAAAAVAGSIYNGDKDFLLIDPEGERTDVGLVINNILLDQYSFTSHRRNTSDAVPPKEEWLNNLRSTLKNFSTHSLIPRTTLLLAQPKHSPVYSSWLIGSGFAPLPLSAEMITPICELAPGLTLKFHPAGRVPAVFIAKVAF